MNSLLKKFNNSISKDETGNFFIRITSNELVRNSHPQDYVDLHKIEEDKALQICVLLGYTDEEIVSLLGRISSET